MHFCLKKGKGLLHGLKIFPTSEILYELYLFKKIKNQTLISYLFSFGTLCGPFLYWSIYIYNYKYSPTFKLSYMIHSLPPPPLILLGFFSFSKKFIYSFIYFWLRWVFVAARGLSLVAASRGYSSLRCAGFSLRWLLLLQSTGSRPAGFSSCGTWASVVVARGL